VVELMILYTQDKNRIKLVELMILYLKALFYPVHALR
jgi:hypothetical protein